MSLIDDLKAKADQNGDGKINKADLEDLRSKFDDETIDKLKTTADQNDDGKINLDDAKNIDFGKTFDDIKNAF